MSGRKQMKAQLLMFLNEDGGVVPDLLDSLNTPENSVTKLRVLRRIESQLNTPLSVGKIRNFKLQPVFWGLASAVCAVFFLLFQVHKGFNDALPVLATLTQPTGKQEIQLDKTALKVAQKFNLAAGTELVIKGSNIETQPIVFIDRIATLPITSGKFIVTYNRDHKRPPMDFLVDEYRVTVVGTIFGVYKQGYATEIAVLDGKIKITDKQSGIRYLQSGELASIELGKIKLAKIGANQFQAKFGQEPTTPATPQKSFKNRSFKIREIDEREAKTLIDSK